jgi:cytochrome c biogenesis protein CcmG, thiol:disulfide interchange protein DsbE
VRRTVRRLRLNYPIVVGDAKLGEEYGGVLGLPVTYLVDREGMIVRRIKGETDLHVLEFEVKQVLDSE